VYDLILHCGDHLPKWWDCERTIQQGDLRVVKLLAEYCEEYIDIWLPCALKKLPWLKALVRTIHEHIRPITKTVLAQYLEGGV